MNALINWLDDRTGLKKLMHEALYENIPGGARWRYVWGSTLVFTFAIQVITGIFLWTAYSPSTTSAWESVYYIQHHMQAGWLVRGLHHYSASMMTVLLALHLMQVVIDGAYKAPREINFWLGLILMQIVLGLGLTGYLLPWDQKGYYATQVSTEIMGATPVVGPQLQQLAQGGPQYGHHTLTRFFAMHAGILPGTLIAFLVLHIAVFRRHGITVPDPDRAPAATFWPDQVLKDGIACMAVLATVLTLTIWKGAELAAPADPSEAYSAARPEWYFLFLFQFLRFEWVEHQGLAFGAIYLPGALMAILAAMPIIGRWKAGHAFNVIFLFVMMVGIIGLTGLALKNDAADPDFTAAVRQAHEDSVRIEELAARPEGIPLEGAVSLLRADPKAQGPRLFARNCAPCHRYNGHDGTGRDVVKIVINNDGTKGRVKENATATDLGNFGSPEWIKAVITDFKGTFAAFGNLKDKENQVVPALKHFLEGDMSEWSASHALHWRAQKNEQALADLVAFLHSQGQRRGAPGISDESPKRGRQIFETGKLPVGKFETNCIDCHSLQPIGEDKLLGEVGAGPTLTSY
ncbi:MAG: cytochrome b N-terminal domain-containing protein, partial [Planctomycetaceae bacterium]|nr:cytochrome b N-terminal domain-containing protein [Planctomycetaceae bacterium]